MKDDGIILTDEMKAYIDANWDKQQLIKIVKHIFKNEKLDGRSKEGAATIEYITSKGYSYKTTKADKRIVDLTDEMKEFIYANSLLKPYEIARIIFKNEKINQFSKESIVVQDFLKRTNPSFLQNKDEIERDIYNPPKTFSKMWTMICKANNRFIEEDKINQATREKVNKCLEFMQTTRFLITAGNYRKTQERELFVTEYIKAVWDKDDLTTDEVNLYINLCQEYVTQLRTELIITKLNGILEETTDDDAENRRMSMTLAETIGQKTKEIDASVNRQKRLVEMLSGKRAERRKLKTASSKSLVSLVEAFKEEEGRKEMLRFAELNKQLVEKEITRQMGFDEWECSVFGISPEEILE